MTKLIEKWYVKVKPYLFSYKKGFFILPYINNTPQLMWESLQKMPFIRFSRLLNMSESNTPFLHAKMYFQELEKDLVVFYNEIYYKKNVSFEHYRKKDLPLEYYCLTGFLSDTSEKKLKTIVNDIHFHGQLWILHKPDAILRDYHFKNSHTKTIILYFTQEWLERYMQSYPEGNEKLQYFIKSANQSVGRTYDQTEKGTALLDEAGRLMKQKISPGRVHDMEEYVYEVMAFFKYNALEYIEGANYMALNNVDLLKIIEAERLLVENLTNPFPGISAVSSQIGLSETKLKSDFKQLYKTSLFQYFREKQMEKAKEMLMQNPASIKNIATLFGYENKSKFSTAFKNHHGILPSEVKTISDKDDRSFKNRKQIS